MRKQPTEKRQGRDIGMGVALGLLFGSAVAAATGNPALIGVGLALGVALSQAWPARE